MDYHEILISGFGGQGVMAIGKTLAEAGMYEGLNVSWLPSYGPEMRGGTANCGVAIAKGEIISPIVLEPDYLIAMNLPSLD
ncbi:MAG: 2-oxoacid:acceptor oxidoreductase family protein, partial [Clostridia bacterium]|nr:2-oxoacid:acceptor oxidoreductase family protein [Clostridia bacterium]